MAAIQSAGIGSGIDINSLVSQLVAAEAETQLAPLGRREVKVQGEISALGALKGALSEFQSSLSGLTDLKDYQSRIANNTNNDLFSVGVDSDATPGTYQVEVKTLAQTHKIVSSAYTETTDIVGSGSLTFQFGTYDSGLNTFTLNPDKSTKTVVISSQNNTLEGIRDEVNSADIGVTATIINDGTGERLVFASAESGAANSLKVTVNDDDSDDLDNAGLSELAYDPIGSAGTGKNLSQTLEAKDTELVVDGLSVFNSSNTINDVIPGVTMNLKKADAGNPSFVTVSVNTAQTSGKIHAFKDNFNKLVDTINGLAGYDSESGKSGLLFGDSSVRAIDMKMRTIITSMVSDLNSTYKSLSDIGVKTTSSGKLEIDSALLTKALENNIEDVGKVLAAVGNPTDSLVKFNGSTEKTDAGNYSINITQMATQGDLVGQAAANTTITAGVNDTLVLDVDGQTATIIMTAGSYTAATLAAELQSRVNGVKTFEDNGISIKVTESAGILTITSQSYGEESTADVTGGNGKSDLVGASPVTTAGLNIEGTIGGLLATGNGQFLTGTGVATGLKIEVIGGSIGTRGSISYSRGIAQQLDDILESFLKSDGTLDSRTKSLNNQVEQISDRREAANRRLARLETRLFRQFGALDILVAQMRSTSDFLTGQLANLPGPVRPSK